MPFSACGRSDGARMRDEGSGIAVAYLVAHGCGEREVGERNDGLARTSSVAAPSGCMATARLTARRHEKAQRQWDAGMVLPKGAARVCAGQSSQVLSCLVPSFRRGWSAPVAWLGEKLLNKICVLQLA